jgi:tetratricopeptide (TPR) repeat protein
VEAIAEFQQNVANDRSAYSLSYLGHAYAMAGRRDEALAVLKGLDGQYNNRESLAQYQAAVYAGLGDKDQAFAWLEKGFQDKNGSLDFVVNGGKLRPAPQRSALRRLGTSHGTQAVNQSI